MTEGIFRVALPDGSIRLAVGDPGQRPSRLLLAGRTVADALRAGAGGLSALVAEPTISVAPEEVRVLAPVDTQEIWAAGVTYRKSRDARKDESTTADVYDRVYVAERPELFFKAAAWRVRGLGETIGVRADSDWNVPEPELGIVVASDGSIAGFVIGNDVSSRSIEGENPLYLPQAKVYDQSCALGPCLVPADQLTMPLSIGLTINRPTGGVTGGWTSTAEITREFADLVEHLTRALAIPDGAILLTGTGIVPAAPFTLLPGDVVRIEIGASEPSQPGGECRRQRSSRATRPSSPDATDDDVAAQGKRLPFEERLRQGEEEHKPPHSKEPSWHPTQPIGTIRFSQPPADYGRRARSLGRSGRRSGLVVWAGRSGPSWAAPDPALVLAVAIRVGC